MICIKPYINATNTSLNTIKPCSIHPRFSHCLASSSIYFKMAAKISLLLALCSLSIFSSLSHGSRVPTASAAAAATTAVSTTDYYDEPPPWAPPEWFYGYFPPQVADMIRQQVRDMSNWMGQFQPPYDGGSYPQPQPQPQPRPQPPPVRREEPDYPAPGECTGVTQVIDTCAQKRAAKSVTDGYSWSCSYNEYCCRAAYSVSDECSNYSPMMRTIKDVCCPRG